MTTLESSTLCRQQTIVVWSTVNNALNGAYE